MIIDKKFELHTRDRIQAVSWERCTFSNEILHFEIVLPKNRGVSCIFKFGGNFYGQNTFEN